jgi:cardiolipin synthase
MEEMAADALGARMTPDAVIAGAIGWPERRQFSKLHAIPAFDQLGEKSILITNPYFIPDDVMVEALVKAAARGVRVIVLVPGKIDTPLTYTVSRGRYGRLIHGGVQIFEYQAGLLHAKTMVVDGVWATVGSTNFDNRSFALNQEINLTVYDRAVARYLERIFQEDLRYAKQVTYGECTYGEWQSQSLYERLVDLFAFPVKDQL